MDWVKAISIILLFVLACPGMNEAEEQESKRTNIDDPPGENDDDDATAEAARRVELSKEGIMFGNQQNKLVGANSPPDVDSTGSDGGVDDHAKAKPAQKGKIIQGDGDGDKDYQYEEPYALYRKKRGLGSDEEPGLIEDSADSGNMQVRQRRRVYHLDPDEEDKGVKTYFANPEDLGGHFLTADQLPQFYENIEPKDVIEPGGKLEAGMLWGIAEELIGDLKKQWSPWQAADMNKDDTYNTRHGSTLPGLNPQSHKPIESTDDIWYDAEMLEKHNRELAKLYELTMLLLESENKDSMK